MSEEKKNQKDIQAEAKKEKKELTEDQMDMVSGGAVVPQRRTV